MDFMMMYPDASGTEVNMLDAGRVTDLARATEAAGFKGLAFTEHPAPSETWLTHGGHQSLDPFVALAAAASVTEQIRLLTFLTVVPYRNPMLLAKTAASLDLVSDGRFILGAGAGYLKSEFFALGVDFEERNALLEESLEVVQQHWSGEAFSYEGRHFSAKQVIARPRPTQNPIPIWMGGNSNAALRRTARFASGWMPMMGSAEVAQTARTQAIVTPEDLAERLSVLRGYAGERFDSMDLIISYHGRDLTNFRSEVERHRDGLGQLAEMGAKWIMVTCDWAPAPAAADWIAEFGETFIS
jgi:probable F420-dependent oxidoreductase